MKRINFKTTDVIRWLDETLDVASFDDVSNNGLQIERDDSERPIAKVAFAVDASLKSVAAAVKADAQMLVVHHGISWGGGIKRLTGGIYAVVREAMSANLAVYASHLPLDAHPKLGNNAQLAEAFKLCKMRPAFSYHGNVIGLIGQASRNTGRLLGVSDLKAGDRVGVCSGGAGAYAEEAQRLGCAVYVTGEADWGEVIAAENCGMRMICRGHYETETGGVRALAVAMQDSLSIETIDLTE